MRSIIALPALIAAATAQSFSFATTSATTTDDDVQPTATETLSSGPVETAKACGQISDLVRRSSLDYPSVEAEVSLHHLRMRHPAALGDWKFMI
jgi:hypothetical protein